MNLGEPAKLCLYCGAAIEGEGPAQEEWCIGECVKEATKRIREKKDE